MAGSAAHEGVSICRQIADAQEKLIRKVKRNSERMMRDGDSLYNILLAKCTIEVESMISVKLLRR